MKNTVRSNVKTVWKVEGERAFVRIGEMIMSRCVFGVMQNISSVVMEYDRQT